MSMPVPACAKCGQAMDLVLALAGYRSHPCCDPQEKPAAANTPSRQRPTATTTTTTSRATRGIGKDT